MLLIIIVVVLGDGWLFFFVEFDNFSDILVVSFRYKGVKRDKVVGLYFEWFLEYLVVYVVILKVGGVYMLLELLYLESLLCLILEDV